MGATCARHSSAFVPQLLRDEWPAREYGSGLFPKDLLRESIPAGDIHIEEERRLLYVALTRCTQRLGVVGTLPDVLRDSAAWG